MAHAHWRRRRRLNALAVLLVALHAAAGCDAAVPTRPGAPGVAALSAPNPFKLAACAQAGAARTAAGCHLLTALVKPPASNGGAVITSYRVTCVPAGCPFPSTAAAGGRRLLAPRNCTPFSTSGMGVLVSGGQRRFKFPFPKKYDWMPYDCRAAARNVKGWGIASAKRAVSVPPSPPTDKPTVRSITHNSARVVVVKVTKPPAGLGINSYIAIGQLGSRATAGVAMQTAAFKEKSDSVELYFQPWTQYRPSTGYLIKVRYAHKHGGALLGPLSDAKFFTTPVLPPKAPTINSVEISPSRLLTLLLTPPTDNGGDSVDSYDILCRPTVCTSWWRRRLASGAIDPCWLSSQTSQTSMRGAGSPVGDGRLRFTTTVFSWQGPTNREWSCTANATNSAGEGAPSAPKTFIVPASVPDLYLYPPMADLRVTSGVLSGSIYFLSNSAATAYVVEGVADDGGPGVTLTGPLFSTAPSPVMVPPRPVGNRPNVGWTFSAYTTKGSSKSSTRTSSLRTQPAAPVITAVEYIPSADGTAIESARLTLQAPPGTAVDQLNYTVVVAGLPEGPTTVEAGTSAAGDAGARLVTVPAAYALATEYTFTATVTNYGGTSTSSSAVKFSTSAASAPFAQTTPAALP